MIAAALVDSAGGDRLERLAAELLGDATAAVSRSGVDGAAAGVTLLQPLADAAARAARRPMR